MQWKEIIGVAVFSSLMYLPYMFFDFIFRNFHHYIFMGAVTTILLLFPLLPFSLSTWRHGFLSGMVFASVQLFATSSIPTEPRLSLFLFSSFLVYSTAAGISSHSLSNKRGFWFYFFVSIMILTIFRWYLG